MIYLLTAIGLSPGGSSTVHIYTNNTQNNTVNLGRVRAVPRLASYTVEFALQQEKARKNLCQGSRRVPVGMMKTKYTDRDTLFLRLSVVKLVCYIHCVRSDVMLKNSVIRITYTSLQGY
jgi:hypothetical protein